MTDVLFQAEAATSGARGAGWPAWLLLTHAAADGVLAASFVIIPAALLVLLSRRLERDRTENRVITLFVLFILALGITHLFSLFSLWIPLQGPEGVAKAAAAFFALICALALWRAMPALLQLPSRERLQAEIAAHLRTSAELQSARSHLEERVAARTKELAQANQRFEIALRGSPIAVFTQDRNLRYTWVYNAPENAEAGALIGRTDEEAYPTKTAALLSAAKRQAMQTGEVQEIEANLDLLGRGRHFYLSIEALRDETGEVVGIASAAVDITDRKSSETQLRLLLRELTHRSKNLLAVIQSIARQTASRSRSIEDFLDTFNARLVAIASAQDLLVADDWQGASLQSLIELQLSAYGEARGQVTIEGADVILKPDAVQHLGLALHELAANASRFGALSTPEGRVRIRLNRVDDAQVKLVWQEHGGPEVSVPERMGFGRTMLERVVGQALQGKVKLTFPPKGVRWEIELPAAQIASHV